MNWKRYFWRAKVTGSAYEKLKESILKMLLNVNGVIMQKFVCGVKSKQMNFQRKTNVILYNSMLLCDSLFKKKEKKSIRWMCEWC